MAYGQKMGSLKALKKSMAKGGSNSAWIKYVPKNGTMNVRFIEEPEHWVNYIEHFDSTARKSFPCNGETSCPGCMAGERKTPRYLTNAVDLDTDRVIPLQLPKDLANRLVVKYEKNGTLIDRDYELSRTGEGLDTVYDFDWSPPKNRNLSKYQTLDLLKVLDDSFNDLFGGDTEDDEDDAPKAKPTVKGRAKSAAAAVTVPTEAEVDEDDDEEDEEEAPKSTPKKKSAAAQAKSVPAPVFTPEDDEEDEESTDAADVDEDEEEEAESEEETYTEEELKALPLGALRAVARDFDVDTKGKKASQIIAEIMEQSDPAPF